MISKGKGGSNTKTGLIFEGKTDLSTFLNLQKGYSVKTNEVFYNKKLVARIFKNIVFIFFLKSKI